MNLTDHVLPRAAGGGTINAISNGWRLEIPAGEARPYRLAQLDDYGVLTRSAILHFPPYTLHLRARVSAPDLPGTWGFGLWNDPFGFSLGFGGQAGRLPVLPQTAWFMHASPPNWLSLRNDPEKLPANGFFAGTFRSPRLRSFLLLPALPALALCFIRPYARILRRLASQMVHQDAVAIDVDVTRWHEYSISWSGEYCVFQVDGIKILNSPCSPLPPLGFVLWIDNQYAAWTPEGRLRWGTLENEAAWMEVENLKIEYSPIFAGK